MTGTLRRSLLAFLNIRPGESQLVGLVLLYAILLFTVNVLTRTASYALFLADFGAAMLPYAYVGVAVFATLISSIVLRLNERFSLVASMIGVHSFLLITLVAYWLGLFSDMSWLIFSLPIYFGVNTSLSVSSFWNLLGRLYSLQQGKRLFGLLGSGENIATIITGFFAPALVAWLGTPNLLLVAAVVMVATLGLLIFIVRTNAGQMAESNLKPAGDGSQRRADGLLRNHYVQLIMAFFALYIVGIYFVDNIFYSQAELRYADANAMAGFIGFFFGVYGVLSLLMQLFVTGRLFRRFGVRPMLLATPVGLGLICLLFALTGSTGSWPVVLFGLAAAANLYRLVLEASDSTAINLLYQPLPDRQRARGQTLLMGVVYPVAIGIAGLLLLLLINLLGFGPVQLMYLLVPLLFVWASVAFALGRAYPRRLQQALNQRDISGMNLPRPDRSSLMVFRQGLAHSQVGVVLYSLDLLADLAPETLLTELPALLNHPERQVRLAALRQIEQHNLREALPQIQARLSAEGSRRVQAASLRTLAALGDQTLFTQVSPYLDHPDLELRQGAVIGLLRSGELEGILLAGEKLLAWARSPQPAERTFAAQALGEGGIAGFYRPLLPLLNDEHPQVQRAALAAAGMLKHPNLWPAVVACLASPQARAAAMPALVAGGVAAMPTIEHAFEEAGQSRDVALRLARACGRIGGPQAAALLVRQLGWPDVQVRAQVLAALHQAGYRAETVAQSRLQDGLRAEVAQAAWTLAGIVDLDNGATEPAARDSRRLLRVALERTLSGQRDRILYWLALRYDPQAIGQVRETLKNSTRDDSAASVQQRDYALEVLEVLLPAEQRTMLRPLFEPLGPAERLQRLIPLFPQPRLSAPARLAAIIRAPAAWLEPWPRACALEAASFTRDAELAEAIGVALADPDPLVRASAAAALARLNGAPNRGHTAELGEAQSPGIAQATDVREAVRTGKGMLTLVEKVMRLRMVDVFVEAPEEVLAEAAALLTELEVKSGETILARGALCSALYLVVDGQVGLQNGEHNSATLEEGERFGDLALLNPTVQPTAVVALSDARLLRLDQVPLFELLEDHPSVALAIVQRLAQRLQRVGQDRGEQARADLLGGLKEKLGRRG